MLEIDKHYLKISEAWIALFPCDLSLVDWSMVEFFIRLLVGFCDYDKSYLLNSIQVVFFVFFLSNQFIPCSRSINKFYVNGLKGNLFFREILYLLFWIIYSAIRAYYVFFNILTVELGTVLNSGWLDGIFHRMSTDKLFRGKSFLSFAIWRTYLLLNTLELNVSWISYEFPTISTLKFFF